MNFIFFYISSRESEAALHCVYIFTKLVLVILTYRKNGASYFKLFTRMVFYTSEHYFLSTGSVCEFILQSAKIKQLLMLPYTMYI